MICCCRINGRKQETSPLKFFVFLSFEDGSDPFGAHRVQNFVTFTWPRCRRHNNALVGTDVQRAISGFVISDGNNWFLEKAIVKPWASLAIGETKQIVLPIALCARVKLNQLSNQLWFVEWEKNKGRNQLCFVELGKKRNCPSNCCLLELDEKNNDKTKCSVVEKK